MNLPKVQKRIIYTRYEDKGISAICPAPEVLYYMQNGGCFLKNMPHGFLERQVAKQAESGVDPDHAKKFLMAVMHGGCTEAEAFELIKNRDGLKYGYNFDIIHRKETPIRWFRNAWKRSDNGGPIYVDLEKAKPIQWRYIKEAAYRENKERDMSFEEVEKLDLPWNSIRYAIRHARDEDELMNIWPEGLKK